MQKTARKTSTCARSPARALPAPWTHRRSGSILLECLLALALLVGAGVTVLGAMDRAGSAAARMAEEKDAMDAVASAMAQVQCGQLSLESLQGPVSKWRQSVRARADWNISVDSEPSEFSGLTLVTLRAFRSQQGTIGTDETPVATLQQFVRLSPYGPNPSRTRGGSGEQDTRNNAQPSTGSGRGRGGS